MAKTTDELFAEATEADYETAEPVTLAASDTEEEFQFRIDEHLRTIAIPEKGVVAGVEGDLNVNIARFTMTRYYHGRDLSKLNIRINYRNANGQVNYYTVSDATVSGDSIVFSWEFAADVTQYKGNVQFVVYLFSATNAVLKQRFFTTLGTLEVLEGLEVDSSIPVSEQTDILLHLKKDLSAYAEEVKKSLPADYTAMTEQVNSLKEDLENLIVNSVNLYNRDNVLFGKILTKDGVVDNEDWDLSEEIKIEPNSEYSIKCFFYKKTASTIIISHINKYGTYLSSDDIYLEPNSSNDGGFTFHTSENATRIRINTKNAYYIVLVKGENIPVKYAGFVSKYKNREITYKDSDEIICNNILDTSTTFKNGTLNADGSVNTTNWFGIVTYDFIPVRKGSIITGNLTYSDSTMAYQICEYEHANEESFIIYSGILTKQNKYIVKNDCYIRIAVYDYNETIKSRIDFYDRIQIGLLIAEKTKVIKTKKRYYINQLIPCIDDCGPKSSNSFALFNQSATYIDFIKSFIQLLKTNNDYASFKIIGNDASNTKAIYKFSLKSKGIYANDNNLIVPRSKAKIMIISGVHGFEKASCFALYYFVRELIECNSPVFDYLKYNVDFEIIPVANPWGFDELSYRQSENININRDSDYKWEKNSDAGTGDTPYSAVETRYLRDFIKENYDAMFMIDWHTTGAIDFKTADYTNWISDNLYDFANEDVLLANIAHGEYISRYINQKYSLGYESGTMLSKLTHEITTGCTDAIACGIGVHGVCFEVSPKVEHGAVHDGNLAKMNVELFTHYIMSLIKQFSKNN